MLHNGILKYFRDQKSFTSNQRWLGYLSCEGMEVSQNAGKNKVERVLQGVVGCCRVLQGVAGCYSVLQYVAV